MFVSMHFPLADVRRYVASAPVIAWPPGPNAFVRGFGPARARTNEKVVRIPAEDTYYDARRALRFEPFLGKRRIGADPKGLQAYCGHRRLLGDGLGAMRFEVGIGSYAASPPRQLSGDDLLAVLAQFFALPVKVYRSDGVRNCELARASTSLARAFLGGTTPRKTAPEGWWVTAGRPLCLVMYDPGVELVTLPSPAKEIATVPLSPRPNGAGGAATTCSVAHLNMWHHGTVVRLLLLGVGKARGADQDQLRRLRIHLARVHTERECLKQVFALIEQDRLTVDPKQSAGDRLSTYLQAVFSRIRSPTFDGFPQEQIVRGMEDGQDCISPEQRAAVMDRLGAMAKAVRSAAEAALIGANSAAGPMFTLQSGTLEVTYVQNNSGVIGGTSNQVVNAQTIHGPVVNGMIRDSFNTIEQSNASENLKKELSTLASLVTELTGQLDKQKATTAARDLKSVTEEVTDPNPRRPMYDVSAGGLLEAAKFVGDFATRIGASLAAVAALAF